MNPFEYNIKSLSGIHTKLLAALGATPDSHADSAALEFLLEKTNAELDTQEQLAKHSIIEGEDDRRA